jgi:hypothetical protein
VRRGRLGDRQGDDAAASQGDRVREELAAVAARAVHEDDRGSALDRRRLEEIALHAVVAGGENDVVHGDRAVPLADCAVDEAERALAVVAEAEMRPGPRAGRGRDRLSLTCSLTAGDERQEHRQREYDPYGCDHRDQPPSCLAAGRPRGRRSRARRQPNATPGAVRVRPGCCSLPRAFGAAARAAVATAKL